VHLVQVTSYLHAVEANLELPGDLLVVLIRQLDLVPDSVVLGELLEDTLVLLENLVPVERVLMCEETVDLPLKHVLGKSGEDGHLACSYLCFDNGELIDPIFAYLTTLWVQTLEEGCTLIASPLRTQPSFWCFWIRSTRDISGVEKGVGSSPIRIFQPITLDILVTVNGLTCRSSLAK
jgi:hypothetical protein